MTVKAKAAIIGPGNIGTDLLMKCQRSEFIEATWMVGIEESAGIQRAREFGLKTSTEGVDGLVAGFCLLYTSPSPRDCDRSRMPSSA